MRRARSSRPEALATGQDVNAAAMAAAPPGVLPAAKAAGLTAYRVQTGTRMPLVPAQVERDWLDATADRFGYRCLPVLIANQAGWFILNSHGLDVVWNGGDAIEDLTVTYREGDPPYPALSHFGHGILTWHIPYLFETPPGIQLLARGPANWPKDGISPLEGVVETEWAAATFTMNWQMTRPRRRVSFVPGEPICMVVPVALGLLEQTRPELRRLASDPARQARFQTWSAHRAAFLTELADPDSPAAVEGWQKDYFRGKAPDGSSAPSHRTRLRLQPFIDVDGISPATSDAGDADPDPDGA